VRETCAGGSSFYLCAIIPQQLAYTVLIKSCPHMVKTTDRSGSNKSLIDWDRTCMHLA
jgi:hypothetical protein